MPRCGSRRRTTALAVAAATAALALAGAGGGLTPPAMAQSAGDDQYVDPLLEERSQRDAGPTAPEPDRGADGSARGDAAPAAPSAPAADDPPAAAEADAAPSVPAETLPRTGVEASLLAAIGLALVAGGMLLRPARRRRVDARA